MVVAPELVMNPVVRQEDLCQLRRERERGDVVNAMTTTKENEVNETTTRRNCPQPASDFELHHRQTLGMVLVFSVPEETVRRFFKKSPGPVCNFNSRAATLPCFNNRATPPRILDRNSWAGWRVPRPLTVKSIVLQGLADCNQASTISVNQPTNVFLQKLTGRLVFSKMFGCASAFQPGPQPELPHAPRSQRDDRSIISCEAQAVKGKQRPLITCCGVTLGEPQGMARLNAAPGSWLCGEKIVAARNPRRLLRHQLASHLPARLRRRSAARALRLAPGVQIVGSLGAIATGATVSVTPG